MALRFHWMLPKGGEMANRETSRVIATRDVSAAGMPDMENWVRFAVQAESAGIESVLLSCSNYEPDTMHIACALGCVTKKLGFIVAYRPGLAQPAAFVQQFNTLSQLVDGRVSLNIVAGSSLAEQRGYGDFLGHDCRYARAQEFISIAHRFWRDDGEFDFDGKYCQLKGGILHTPFFTSDRAAPEIYVAGHSEGAERLALTQGSCWLRVIDTPDTLHPIVVRARRAGVDVCLRLSLVCRPTRNEAIQAAESLKADQNIRQQVRSFVRGSDSRVLKDTLSSADNSDWLSDCLWTGLVPSYGSSAMALVGTPQELSQCFQTYQRIGITQFIISGWPKLEEMEIFGRDVLPLIRETEQIEAHS